MKVEMNPRGVFLNGKRIKGRSPKWLLVIAALVATPIIMALTFGLLWPIAMAMITLIYGTFPFIIGLVVGLIMIILFVAVVIGILSIPVHFILRALGRRGFYHRDEEGMSYSLGSDGFKRA